MRSIVLLRTTSLIPVITPVATTSAKLTHRIFFWLRTRIPAHFRSKTSIQPCFFCMGACDMGSVGVAGLLFFLLPLIPDAPEITR